MDELIIRQRLKQIFREIFDDNSIEIADSTTAADIEAWDSLNHINLIVRVEREFKIRLSTREVQNLQNVGALIALIGKKAP
ncbi:MAG TPA: acyl carrier protein [Steroidobacteraceae bacterium]|jgi:acyl carrier protein|nr:acyl carrier protein [Steroidobacteraceae bacterium]